MDNFSSWWNAGSKCA